MPASAYPAGLPWPQSWTERPRERRVGSGLRQPGDRYRARQRDYQATAEVMWTFTRQQMAAWSTWFKDELAQGLKWWVIRSPGAGGVDVARQVRYVVGSIRESYLGNGLWSVSATLDLQRPVLIQPWVTSLLYPLEDSGAVGSELQVTGLSLRVAYDTFGLVEGLESAVTVTGISLRSLLDSHTVLPEAVESTVTVSGLSLRETLLPPQVQPPEAVGSSVTVTGLSLRTKLIVYSNYPAEALASAVVITGISLHDA